MPFSHRFKPAHKEIKRYYEELTGYATHEVAHEGATSTAFQALLAATCKKADWHLVPQLSTKIKGKSVRPDGTLRDDFNLHRGYWEAKDSSDKIDAEISKKIALGYPLANTIFEDTATAVLYQNGKQVEPRFEITDPQQLCDLLNLFYSHTEPDIEGFEQAVEEFKERVPELALALKAKIEEAHKKNKQFQEAFKTFFDLCRQSLNPNLAVAAVDEMLIQHLLTIRLFDTIFDNPDFVRRNVIAAEVEKVIEALASKSFSRAQFLKSLDRFYVAIESAAKVLGDDFTEKQHFLNTVYERFFQGYSVKVADTHGIVYTPQEIVDFMCASVEEVLKTEFGKTLGSKDVNILDPCTGTGNFIVNLIRRVPKRDLAGVYREQLFANEVMLLPYYIAALNIEHAFYERSGEYEAFEGLCFVDTLDLAERKQQELGFMTEKNTERVQRQTASPITVIVGNPPYNVGQLDENDNNKNRKYTVIDERLSETYARDSSARSVSKLSDPYVKFFRWATDRLRPRDGLLCFVSNNGFVTRTAFDGMRMHLAKDFSAIYHVDLHGDVRKNPKLSGTTHNVFGIQVGVGITIAVRNSGVKQREFKYTRLPEDIRREEKLGWLRTKESIGGVDWQTFRRHETGTWLMPANVDTYDRFFPTEASALGEGVFYNHSLGLTSNRDSVVYDFSENELITRLHGFIDTYNGEVDRLKRSRKAVHIDEFVDYKNIKWSETLKRHLQRGVYAEFDQSKIRTALMRPYCKRLLFFDRVLNERVRSFPKIFPTAATERENQLIAVSDIGFRAAQFSCLVTRSITEAHVCASTDGHQCFPFYIYNEDGTNRRENITDWALQHFREHYHDKRITKWDIFYYVYGILHHPGYRTKFADNLKRELPRIPLAPTTLTPNQDSLTPNPSPKGRRESDLPLPPGEGRGEGALKSSSAFWVFAKAGKKLAELHLNYEQLEPWPLKWIETEGEPLSYHVEKMRLSKDKTQLKVNDSLTLAKIPPEVFDYRLGNRSALDWVIDQYQKSTDKRSGIESDPNNPDDEEYIVRLVGQVVRVSVETVKIVNSLPKEFAPTKKAGTNSARES